MLTVDINIDKSKIIARINASCKKATMAVSQQVLKDSNYYAPQDTGMLHKSAIIHSVADNESVIEWQTPYARRLYYGDTFNFSKARNPNAGARWFDVAKQNRMKDWEKLAQMYFKK